MNAPKPEIGWIVELTDGKIAYVANIQFDPFKVMIRRRQPNGEGWMTHWLSISTWDKKFKTYYGKTAECVECGFLPTVSIPHEHEQYTAYGCESCGHTWGDDWGDIPF